MICPRLYIRSVPRIAPRSLRPDALDYHLPLPLKTLATISSFVAWPNLCIKLQCSLPRGALLCNAKKQSEEIELNQSELVLNKSFVCNHF